MARASTRSAGESPSIERTRSSGRPSEPGSAWLTSTGVPGGIEPTSSRSRRVLPTPASPATRATAGRSSSRSPSLLVTSRPSRLRAVVRPIITGLMPRRPTSMWSRVSTIAPCVCGRPRRRPRETRRRSRPVAAPPQPRGRYEGGAGGCCGSAGGAEPRRAARRVGRGANCSACRGCIRFDSSGVLGCGSTMRR